MAFAMDIEFRGKVTSEQSLFGTEMNFGKNIYYPNFGTWTIRVFTYIHFIHESIFIGIICRQYELANRFIANIFKYILRLSRKVMVLGKKIIQPNFRISSV